MTRADFKAFAQNTLVEVVSEAERESGRRFSAPPVLRWFPSTEIVDGDLAEALATRLFVESERISPCVDIGVCDITADGRPVIFAIVAGYAPQPFGRNWTGREGPFVHIVGAQLASGSASVSESGALAFRILKSPASTTNGA